MARDPPPNKNLNDVLSDASTMSSISSQESSQGSSCSELPPPALALLPSINTPILPPGLPAAPDVPALTEASVQSPELSFSKNALMNFEPNPSCKLPFSETLPLTESTILPPEALFPEDLLIDACRSCPMQRVESWHQVIELHFSFWSWRFLNFTSQAYAFKAW